MSAEWVRIGKQWPDINEDNKLINEFISNLNETQKETLSALLENSYSAGIHDMMAGLSEMYLDGLKIEINGITLPEEPFATELHYDYICRYEGDEWPDE